MESIMSSISSALLLLAAILLWRCQRVARRNQQSAYLGRLDELRQTVELTRRDCLTAIDNLHRRLEALQNRAGSAEHQLIGLVEPPPLASKEKFQAAALLLAGGHAAERVATVLGLPVGQIELVKELQKVALAAHFAPLLQESVTVTKSPGRRHKKKLPNGEAGKRARPILLTDVVRLDGAHAGKAEAAA